MHHQPATQAASTRVKTTTLFSTEKSMMRLIMGASDGHVTDSFGVREPLFQIRLRFLVEVALAVLGAEVVGDAAVFSFQASSRGLALVGPHATDGILDADIVEPGVCAPQTTFRIHEEVAADHDVLARCDAAHNLYALAKTPSGFDCARLKDPARALDEYSLTQTGIEHSIRRDRDSARQVHRKLDVHKRVWPQGIICVLGFEPQIHRTGGWIEQREHIADTSRKLAVLVRQAAARR